MEIPTRRSRIYDFEYAEAGSGSASGTLTLDSGGASTPGDVRKTWSVPEEVTGSMSRIEELVDVKATKGYSKAGEGTWELDAEKRSLKQRILSASKITPPSSSSSSTGTTSRTLTLAAKDEKESEAIRVAFEEGGEVMEGSMRTSSMDMTAAEFRRMVKDGVWTR